MRMTLQEAIDFLTRNYTFAVSEPTIRNPVEWALYNVWRYEAENIIATRCEDCVYFERDKAQIGDVGRCRNDHAPCQNQQTYTKWFCADGERKKAE